MFQQDYQNNRKKHYQENLHLSIIESFSNLITYSKDVQELMDNLVKLIADKLSMDVCSLFLYEKDAGELVLKSTIGFNQEAVGKVRVKPSESLTGISFEKKRPITVNDPQNHPRYYYFSITGEEKYNSFLSVPIMKNQEPIGVIIVQTKDTYHFHIGEINLLRLIAAQVASIIQVASLLEERKDNKIQKSVSTINTLQGIPTSKGYGTGKAVIFDERFNFSVIPDYQIDDIDAEIQRLNVALEKSKNEITELKFKTYNQLSEDESSIFDAHLMILNDPAFKEKIVFHIRQKENAALAVSKMLEEYTDKFSKIEDTYFKDRIYDIEDIAKRIISHLLGLSFNIIHLTEQSILVAKFITPSTTINIDPKMIVGIVTEHGGVTSHASILARSLDIPAVVGVKNIIEKISIGTQLLVDGDTGFVFIDPNRNIIDEYEKVLLKAKEQHRIIIENIALPSITKDNVSIKLSANVGLPMDVELAKKNGATDVGLFRTEFSYMVFSKLPGIDEQVKAYKKIVSGFPNGHVNIRTLDIGGDKSLPYIKFPVEENPYLGFRSIRFSLNSLDIFKVQIKAILLTSQFGNVKILLPMITTLNEIMETKDLIEQCKEELEREGYKIGNVPVGMMVEVPAVVFQIEEFMKLVDFISIGTNDLVQYLLAVDRNNEKVSNMYNPLNPAVLNALGVIQQKALTSNKSVSVCGEMAGHPISALALLSLGITELSITPSAIPIIKYLVRNIEYKNLLEIKKTILSLKDEKEIEEALYYFMMAHVPELTKI